MENENSQEIGQKLQYICQQFRIPGEVILHRWIPSGHINEAYYAAVYDGKEVKQFLIQKVNTYVFREPISMMNNIELITRHIMGKERAMERRRRLHFHHTAYGHNYLVLKDGVAINPSEAEVDWAEPGNVEFWRLYNFIESSTSFETADGNPEVLRMSGKAFGKFNKHLQDFDASQLVESIQHFHDTAHRLKHFFDIVERDELGRAKDVQAEINLIRENAEFGCTLCRQIEKGELPLRVTHNDTKTNNILFDRDTLDPLVVIDLDTCMPGLACYDFGDTIRFAACTAEEDQPEGMSLDLGLFRAYAEGYLSEMHDILSEAEKESLAVGAAVITLELASRFLGDYLEGDKYFRIDSPDQNLRRAQAQLVLFQDMMMHMDEMKKTIREVAEEFGNRGK